MQIINTPHALRAWVKEQKKKGKSVGFVPTMGFLHEGHLSLMQKARMDNDVVIVSIFVNPTQFGPGEDLESYPRDFERDKELCDSVGVDVIFAPGVKDMYPEGYSTYVDCEGDITKQLCGASRPTHFKGVTSVVSKLFLIVAPDRAYFGQKDAQQVAVIEKMVRELNFDVEIVPCPIVREADGLAMSSRNTYLNEKERKDALVLSEALKLCQEAVRNGERNTDSLIHLMKAHILHADSAQIDYVQIVDAKTLLPIDELQDDYLVALAVKIGKTRLIDNYRISRS